MMIDWAKILNLFNSVKSNESENLMILKKEKLEKQKILKNHFPIVS